MCFKKSSFKKFHIKKVFTILIGQTFIFILYIWGVWEHRVYATPIYPISDSKQLLASAWQKIHQAYRPSTSSAHRYHFRTYLAFIYFMDLSLVVNLHNLLVFLEYLHQNALSTKVIKNYLSSTATVAKFYNIDYSATHHPAVLRYHRGLSLTSLFVQFHVEFLIFQPYMPFPSNVNYYQILYFSEPSSS